MQWLQKRIVRHLLGTMNGGIIINTKQDQALDAYVDADFGDLWQYEDM